MFFLRSVGINATQRMATVVSLTMFVRMTSTISKTHQSRTHRTATTMHGIHCIICMVVSLHVQSTWATTFVQDFLELHVTLHRLDLQVIHRASYHSQHSRTTHVTITTYVFCWTLAITRKLYDAMFFATNRRVQTMALSTQVVTSISSIRASSRIRHLATSMRIMEQSQSQTARVITARKHTELWHSQIHQTVLSWTI